MTDYHYKKHDVIILVESKEIYFYKDVLCKYSAYFTGMFNHEMKEKLEGIIKLDDKYQDITALLNVIYPIKPYKITKKRVYEIFHTAHKYQFQPIITRCLKVLDYYPYEKNDLTQTLNDIMMLDAYTKIYVADEEVYKKLKEIIKKPINILINSNWLLTEEMMEDLPKDILTTIMIGMQNKKLEMNKIIATKDQMINEKDGIIRNHMNFITQMNGVRDRYIKSYILYGENGRLSSEFRTAYDSCGISW